MTFPKMQTNGYPRRLWGLYGFPGSGKSTFAARMRGPILAVDADHRFEEVTRLAGAGVYGLSEAPADNVTPERIAALLRANMPGSDVKTICVDSLTAILAPLVTRRFWTMTPAATRTAPRPSRTRPWPCAYCKTR